MRTTHPSDLYMYSTHTKYFLECLNLRLGNWSMVKFTQIMFPCFCCLEIAKAIFIILFILSTLRIYLYIYMANQQLYTGLPKIFINVQRSIGQGMNFRLSIYDPNVFQWKNRQHSFYYVYCVPSGIHQIYNIIP